MIRKASWSAIVAGGILLATPANAASAGPKAADAGYLMVQGRQIFLLTALPGQDLAARAAEVSRRLEAAVSKDSTVQPIGEIRLTDVAGTPVVSVGSVPIASVTARDATRAGQPAWALAHRCAGTLAESLSSLRVGGRVPETLVKLRSTSGAEIALAAPAAPAGPIAIALKEGRITASIEAGVVTLTGQAATLAEKLDVARQVAEVPGVVDVVNNLVVQAPRTISDAELASALSYAR